MGLIGTYERKAPSTLMYTSVPYEVKYARKKAWHRADIKTWLQACYYQYRHRGDTREEQSML